MPSCRLLWLSRPIAIVGSLLERSSQPAPFLAAPDACWQLPPPQASAAWNCQYPPVHPSTAACPPPSKTCSLLLLGFLLPTWLIWRSELRLRCRFLASRATAGAQSSDILPSVQPGLLNYARLAAPAAAVMYWFAAANGPGKN